MPLQMTMTGAPVKSRSSRIGLTSEPPGRAPKRAFRGCVPVHHGCRCPARSRRRQDRGRASGCGHGARGQGQSHGTSGIGGSLSERGHLGQAASGLGGGPGDLSTTTVPPTPRRPAVYKESVTATSSATTTLVTSMPSAAASFAGHFEVHDVAGVVLDDHQGALARVDGLERGQHLIGRGEVKTSPHTAASACPGRQIRHAAAHARPATGDDSDLAGPGSITTDDETVRVSTFSVPGCAASMPRNASATTVPGSLINFFMPTSQPLRPY